MSYARSYIVQTLHGNPAASSLGRAHRLGAPYSSTVRPRGVRPRLFTRCGLAEQPADSAGTFRDFF
jgi:hypothetical protein